MLDRLDVAAATTDAEVRRRALTFVFVGGGYAGIEALAEMEDMARDALRYYPELEPDDMRWVLVEATQRILPEVDRDMGAYTVQQLLKRGMDIRLDTRLESCVDGVVKLSDGDSFRADTIVWTAGVKPSPMLDAHRLAARRRGGGSPACRPCRSSTATGSVEGAWSAGDCAAVPDLTKEPGRATARRAPSTRCGRPRRMADNIRAGDPRPASRSTTGTSTSARWPASACTRAWPRCTASSCTGWPAWFMHRTYHMSRIPSFNRKVRVVVDWTLALLPQARGGRARPAARPARGVRRGVAADSDHQQGA